MHQSQFSLPINKHKLQAEINVVPYIDVMLVLLIVFMVTAPLLTQGVDVQLPEVTSEPLKTDADAIIVSIDEHGQYYLNIGELNQSKKPQPLPDLIQQLDKIYGAPEPSEKPVLIEADKRVPYGAVAHLMSQLQRIKVKSIGFVTDPSDG